jgi:hypothetical protein
MTWRDGRLVTAVFSAPAGGRAVVRYGDQTRALDLKPGESETWSEVPSR